MAILGCLSVNVHHKLHHDELIGNGTKRARLRSTFECV